MATKLLYRINEASEVSSISRSRLYELIASGEVESVKLGSTRLIPHDALEDFVTKLRAEAGEGTAA